MIFNNNYPFFLPSISFQFFVIVLSPEQDFSLIGSTIAYEVEVCYKKKCNLIIFLYRKDSLAHRPGYYILSNISHILTYLRTVSNNENTKESYIEKNKIYLYNWNMCFLFVQNNLLLYEYFAWRETCQQDKE